MLTAMRPPVPSCFSELEELGQRFQQVAEANQLLVTEHKHLSVECADLQHDLRELGMAHTTAKQLLDEKDKECLRLHELKEQIAGLWLCCLATCFCRCDHTKCPECAVLGFHSFWILAN